MEVLVTGGDTDLGRAIAEGFRDAGHRVVVSGSRRDELEVAAKELDIDAIVCDHTDPASLAEVRTQFPHHLDVIVNVPTPRWTDGDPRAYTPVQTAAAWHAALDATVLAPVLTLQTVGDHMRSGGAIVTVIPEAVRDGSADSAIKAALSDWTAGQAQHYGTRGITVNTVASGRGAQPGDAGLSSSTPSVSDEITRMALFLSTSGARHITGQTLHVSSGAAAQFG